MPARGGHHRRHPKAIGDQSTAFVLAHLLEIYPLVLVPFGENTRYDLVIEDGDRFIRVQCKTGRLRDGAVRFATSSTSYHHPNNRGMLTYRHDYRGVADVFGVYCPDNGKAYIVPVDEVGTRSAALRVDPPRNNQIKKVRWAADYEIRPG